MQFIYSFIYGKQSSKFEKQKYILVNNMNYAINKTLVKFKYNNNTNEKEHL